MAIGKDGAVLRQLRTLFNVGTVRDLTDGQLLERFATDGARPPSWPSRSWSSGTGRWSCGSAGACWPTRTTRRTPSRRRSWSWSGRPASLWVRDSLGPWLHQVAYRTASCARLGRAVGDGTNGVRRPAGGERAHVEPADELEQVLHEEIDRLPERYRAPVVLCDLEGRTHEQAARHLGWPVGTVKSRLTRGRERLRDRLLRRGLAPDAGLIASALSPDGPLALDLPPRSWIPRSSPRRRFLTVRSHGPRVRRLTRPGSSPIHDHHAMVESRVGPAGAGATVAGVEVLAQEGDLGRPGPDRSEVESGPEAEMPGL